MHTYVGLLVSSRPVSGVQLLHRHQCGHKITGYPTERFLRTCLQPRSKYVCFHQTQKPLSSYCAVPYAFVQSVAFQDHPKQSHPPRWPIILDYSHAFAVCYFEGYLLLTCCALPCPCWSHPGETRFWPSDIFRLGQ